LQTSTLKQPPADCSRSLQREVRPERSGWRDLRLSERHRRWGWDCPAVDLDFLFLEYDRGKAIALVEYKHERAKPQYVTHPTYQAMIDLGNRAGVPVLAARYADDFSRWMVVPLNAKAKEYLPERREMTEREWVTFLYRLRGYTPPDSLFDGDGIAI
jgi:hypothetical protein